MSDSLPNIGIPAITVTIYAEVTQTNLSKSPRSATMVPIAVATLHGDEEGREMGSPGANNVVVSVAPSPCDLRAGRRIPGAAEEMELRAFVLREAGVVVPDANERFTIEI